MFAKPNRINRRRFLAATSAALPFAAAALSTQAREHQVKIERIEVFPMRYPMTGYFKFFTGPHGSAGRAAVIVKTTADNGVVGWGQSVPIAKWSYETLETATVVLKDYYAPAVTGRDPYDIEGIYEVMDQAVAPAFSTGMPIARAGLELAVHDLAGKLAGLSLPQMWNRSARKNLTLSWTVNVRELDEVEPVMDQGRQKGYRHYNIKVGPDPKFDAELARLVRSAAPDCFLWADANGGYEPAAALEAAPMLAEQGVNALEAPLKPNRISGYQALKKQGALPILMDEGIITPVELDEFIRLDMLDGVAMKPARCGGLLSARRQIELIENAGLIWLGSGLTDPDISMAASLVLYAAYDLQKPAALNGPQFLTADVLKNPLTIRDGMAEVPQGPGLGIEVDEEKVREMAREA